MPPPPADPRRVASTIDAPALIRAFSAALAALERQRDALNAINVFPVPDGDTGTNMTLTMRAACEEISHANPSSASGVARAVADGALMGARGNSGVILSQILSGLAATDGGLKTYDGVALAEGLSRARDAAYRVLTEPREGTILTAIRAAAAASALSAADGGGALDVLRVAAAAAQEATDRTPGLLPVLREAGVVDAGAQGLAYVFDAMGREIAGTDPAPYAGLGSIDGGWLAARREAHAAADARDGYCTEFVIHARQLNAETVRQRLRDFGDSLLVVEAPGLVRVHLHSARPQEATAYGRTLGTVTNERVVDMAAQFRAVAQHAASHPDLAIVAVAAGEGIEALFRSLGAVVVRGGQTMNPSAGDIRAGIEATGAHDVIVLPNNRNVVLAAEQAARAIGPRVRVLPSRSIPQGVAALVAMNPDLAPGENLANMGAAIANVASGEVTRAARSTRIHGVDIREGQPIALINGDLALAAETIDDAVRLCAERMLNGRSDAILTLYAGEGVGREEAETLASSIRSSLGRDVEVVEAGQPHYPYLIGIE
jgi:DAK2 domain fusion protein YloV